MITIILNGREKLVDPKVTASDLIQNMKNKNIVVWINGRKLLRVEYDNYLIKAGDEIKLVHILGGG